MKTTKYVNAQTLLEQLFEESSRPSLRWLRNMTATRKLPFVKIGGKVLFIIEDVRNHLEGKTKNPIP